MYYNEKTGFITYRDVELNRIFVKNGTDTVGIINISDNWDMEGYKTKTSRFPWSSFPIYWDQEACEKLIVMRVAPDRGKEFLQRLGIDKYDTMTLAYMTRGIQLIDNMWLAWSEDDKAEDYHPKFNSELMELHCRELEVID